MNIRINQTYQICNTSLYFFDLNNLFCQFDQNQKVLQFYKYKPLSAFIEPKQKYVYVIEKINLFRRDDNIQCFRVLYENNTQKDKLQLTELMTFQYNCENKQQIFWKSDYSNYFKNNTQNLYSSDGNLKVSITERHFLIIRNDQDFQNNCFARLYKFYHKDKIQFKYITTEFVCFQYEYFFYIYDCKQQKIVNSVNLDQYHVLESDKGYYFVNKSQHNFLRGVLFMKELFLPFNINLNEVITNFKQIYQSIFLYTNISNLPLIILMNYEPLLRYNYLSKNLYQPETILFYFESGSSKFIQYSKILAMENKEIFMCYQFSESLIISIQTQTTIECYSIVSIQNQTNSLILYYFIDYELRQIQNYTFQNYSYYYPIKYAINHDNFAILIVSNNSLYIAIFQYNLSKLSLDEIIATDDTFFKFDLTYLLFSFDKVLSYLLLNKFQVELELKNFQQNAVSQNYSMITKEEGGVELMIQIENQCFQLSSLMKSSRIEIQKNKGLKLNISEMFYGPISNLTILNNANVILKGPYQLIQELLNCNDLISTICIRQYKFETKTTELRFQVIIQENQIFGVINTNTINNYYVTWIKQQYFLCVSQFTNYLNIELIECSEKEDKTCKMISNLDVNFKIDQINITHTMRVGNLIKLNGNNAQAFIVIDDINYNIQILPAIIIDIIYIERSNDQYLVLQKNMIDSSDLELTIYSINLNQSYSQTITEKIYTELIKSGNFNKSKFTIKLISCKYSGELINIKLLTIAQFFSSIFQLNLNQQKNEIQLELQHQFRNLIHKNHSFKSEDYIIQYIDDSFLVIKLSLDDFSQFYEFQEGRKFSDYFHISMFSMQIKRLNTTHFIFIHNLQAQVGLIGYELELENWDEFEQNFELFAQNEISNEKVSLQIHIIKTNLQFTKDMLIIQISCFVFILIYTRKIRSKSRNQKRNSQ